MECPPRGKKFTGFENFQQHLESEKHKNNMLCIEGIQNDLSVDSENSTSTDSKNDKAIKCHVCDLSFNSLESYQNHSATPEHALKIILNQSKISATQSSNSSINNQELNTIKCKVECTSDESILPELNDNKSYLSYGNCELCKKIFSGPEPYKQHIESQAHKKKVALLRNPTFTEGNLRCEPCSKSFSGHVPYAQHMCSEIHKKKLQNLQFIEKFVSGNSSNSQAVENEVKKTEDESKLWFCEICKVQCSGLIPYQQHMEGSTHAKNERRMQSLQIGFLLMNGASEINNGKNQNNLVKADNAMNSMMQSSNSSEVEVSEKFEIMSQVMNSNYQKDNRIIQDNSLFSGKNNELKIVSNDELAQIVKIIPPDEKINFDEIDISKDLANENPNIINQNESVNNSEFGRFQDGYENGFGDNLKKKGENKELEIYQTCKYCNVSLFDKDSAAEHFESKEHFEKRWVS